MVQAARATVDQEDAPQVLAAATRDIANLSTAINVLDYVKGNGVTDDTVALNAALQAAVDKNRGRVTIPSTAKILVNSGDIVFPEGVSLIGTYDTMGEFVNGGQTTARDYHNAGSSIILNPSYTLRVKSRNKLQNLLVISKPVYDLMPVSTVGGAATAAAAFAGTGVYAYAAYDVQIDRCMFLGFNRGIYAINNYLGNGSGTCERGRVTHCLFDCTNCMDWNWASDFAYFESLHAWPFVTSHIGGITGALRTGTAFRVGQGCDWAYMLNCSVYGWNRGFAAGGAHAASFVACKADNNGGNSNSVGFDISDYADPITSTTFKPNLASLIACKTAAHSIGVRINTTDTAYPSVHITDHMSWGTPATAHIQIVAGQLQATNVSMQSGTTGIDIQATAGPTSLVNVWGKNVTTIVANATASGVVSQFNVRDYGTGKATNNIPSLSTTAAWNEGHVTMGAYHLWVDTSGRLRIKSSAPASDTDGTVVGTQT